MSLTYLLDTNIVSEPLRPGPNQRILKRLQQHEAETAIAAVVWHEFGAHRLPLSAKRTVIEEYFNDVVASTFPILPYDIQPAQRHAAPN